MQGSIVDEEVLAQAFSEPLHYIFHFAALFANQNSVDNPEKDLKTNALGTLKLLEYAIQSKALKRFVYASSSCVYGMTEGILTEASVPKPATPYAVSKLAGEHYVGFFYRLYGFPTTIIRYFNVYGPGERPGRYRNVIPNFIDLALRKQPLPITGDGKETREFVFVGDVIEGTLRAATSEKAIGEVLNMGSGEETKIIDLANKVNQLVDNRAGIVFTARRNWDGIRRRTTAVDKMRRLLEYVPTTSLDEGLGRTVSWLKGLGDYE